MAGYRFLADTVALVHFAYVAFVVLGMAAIVAGAALGWQWVRNFWFRAIHLLMIALVVAESLCGVLCPLTDWEDRLRELAGEPNEPGSFIGRAIHRVLFVDASSSVLALCYCVFGLAVLLMLIVAPPRRPGRRSASR
jgi:polyferredoxin